jgi:hypothetical protein
VILVGLALLSLPFLPSLPALIGAADVERGKQQFDEAVQRTAEGRYREALLLAQEVPDALERSRALVHVLWSAGDRGGAFAAARRGSSDHPRDVWLLERATALAVSLAAAEPAAELLDELRIALGSLPAAERAGYDANLREHEFEVAGLVERLEARRVGARRARWIVLSGALLALFAWRLGAQSRSSTPLPSKGS